MKTRNLFFAAVTLITFFSPILWRGSGSEASAQYTVLHDFGTSPNGSVPYGSLVSDGTFLYGTTSAGGTIGWGNIFKIKPDGTGYAEVFPFAQDLTYTGTTPLGSLIYDDTFLYGMTKEYGQLGYGTIFKVKPDGTGFSNLYNFDGYGNGKFPHGSLVSDGTFLYGMTREGGTQGLGTIFKIMPDGTGFLKLLDFTNTTEGHAPWGSLIYDGSYLFGMARDGTNGSGIIFKISTNGTGYAVLHNFSGGADGSTPYGSLISDGTFLYGMTNVGGLNGSLGTLFKIKPDGTEYTKLRDFSGYSDGSLPYGSLISDGTFLYGMTGTGGTLGYGTIFKIKPDGTEYDNLYDFTGTAGRFPWGDLVSVGGSLYGMTSSGGANLIHGVIFKLGIVAGTNENKSETDFTIYPNPNYGIFTVATTTRPLSLEILNMLGEKVYKSESKSGKQEIDLSKEPNGIYFIQLKTENNILFKKITIQK